MDECIIEGCEDTGDAEDEFTWGSQTGITVIKGNEVLCLPSLT